MFLFARRMVHPHASSWGMWPAHVFVFGLIFAEHIVPLQYHPQVGDIARLYNDLLTDPFACSVHLLPRIPVLGYVAP